MEGPCVCGKLLEKGWYFTTQSLAWFGNMSSQIEWTSQYIVDEYEHGSHWLQFKTQYVNSTYRGW